MTTEEYSDVRYSIDKIFDLTGHAVWAGAGDQQTVLDINEALTEARDTIATASNRPQALVDAIKPVLERRYNNVVKIQGEPQAIPWTDSLACGCYPGSGDRWIIEVDRHCNALLAHFRPAEKPLDYGKLHVKPIRQGLLSSCRSGAN